VALLLQEPIPAAGKIKERDAEREERIVSKRASPLEPSPRFHQAPKPGKNQPLEQP